MADTDHTKGGQLDPEDADRLAEAHGKTDFAGFPEEADEGSPTEDLARDEAGPPAGGEGDEREQPRSGG